MNAVAADSHVAQVGAPVRCAFPLPRVTKPQMGSGGAGLQHLASWVIERVDAHHQRHPRRRAGPLFFLSSRNSSCGRIGLGRAQDVFRCCAVKIRPAYHFKQFVRCAKPQLGGQVVELDGGLAFALQQLFDCLAPAGNGLTMGGR